MQLILIEWKGSSDCDVITLFQIFKCRLTVGILPADIIPTVGRQTFRGAVLHFYPFSQLIGKVESPADGKIVYRVRCPNQSLP